MKLAKVRYPWLSIFSSLLIVGWFVISSRPELIAFYQIPSSWLQQEISLVTLVVYCLLLLAETTLFVRSKKLLQQQLDQIWQGKQQLQKKARTYSSHADKLKLFISEKLLEQIEYDEKYLHFKSIASEVRHNGVISYDKVKIALGLAMQREAELQEKAHISRNANSILSDTEIAFHDALNSMRYLWDLLDLSTTDNIAMHVSNHLCECEEQYYQKKLNPDENTILFESDFSPRSAIIQTLNSVMNLEIDPSKDKEYDDLIIDDQELYAYLQPTETMMGNANHLVLIMENLIKNAQFFAGKQRGTKKYSGIRLGLEEKRGVVEISLYNPGSTIENENKDKIFQLGFSSRRSKGHHGKGLGLFFVKQIVNGYEGKIKFRNIENLEKRIDLMITLEDGEQVEEQIEIKLDEKGKPQCLNAELTELVKSRSWSFKQKIEKIRVKVEGQKNPDDLSGFPETGVSSWLQPFADAAPMWAIEVNQKRGARNLNFIPQDRRGVEFKLLLPTAESYVDGAMEDTRDIDQEVLQLDEPFQQHRVDV